MIRLETYRACEPSPAPERAFVTVGDIVERRQKPKPHDFTAGHMVFYGSTEVEALDKASNWIAAEQARLAGIERGREERAEASRQARAARQTSGLAHAGAVRS